MFRKLTFLVAIKCIHFLYNIHDFFLLIYILPPSSVGDRLGQLWTDGPQMLHGRSSNLIGGAGPQHNGDWLVQALPHLLHGGPNNGATHPPLLPDVPGEHHWALLWAILRLTQKYSFVVATKIPSLSQTNPKTHFYMRCSPAPGSAKWYCPWSR